MRKICSPAVLCLLLCFLAAAGCGNKNRTAGIQMTVLEFSGSLELKLEHFLPDGKVLPELLRAGIMIPTWETREQDILPVRCMSAILMGNFPYRNGLAGIHTP